MGHDDPGEITIAAVDPTDLDRAAALAARGMRDNPLHVAAIGNDPRTRERRMFEVFQVLLAHRCVLGAWRGGELVGVAASAAPGHCRPGGRQLVSLLGPFARFGVHAPRALRWMGTWARRDPGEPHSHLGPVAVDPQLRGQGVGSRSSRRRT